MSEMSVTARALRRRLTVFVAVRGLYALLTTGSEVGAKNFRPTADALPGGAGPGTAKLNHLENRHGHYLYLQTQFGEDRCTQFRVMVVTDPPIHTHTHTVHTHKHTHPQTGPITIHCAAASAQCNDIQI